MTPSEPLKHHGDTLKPDAARLHGGEATPSNVPVTKTADAAASDKASDPIHTPLSPTSPQGARDPNVVSDDEMGVGGG